MSTAPRSPQLAVARRRMIRRTVGRWSLFGAAITAPPTAIMGLLGGPTHAVIVVAASVPGVMVMINYAVRRSAHRLDTYVEVVREMEGDDAAADPLAMATSSAWTDDAISRVAVGARRAAELEHTSLAASQHRERLAAEGLASMFRRRVFAEERAMAVLAAELHDTVAQSLITAQYSAEARAPYEEVHAEIRRAESQLRGVLALTRPPELSAGLGPALEALFAETHAQFDLRVRVLAWPAGPLHVPELTAVTCYRFVQEALRNVVKHSGQLRADVQVVRQGDDLVATVSDAGRGFDRASQAGTPGGRHVGLLLMDDRVQAAGGTLTVHSTPGVGTSASVRLPLTYPAST